MSERSEQSETVLREQHEKELCEHYEKKLRGMTCMLQGDPDANQHSPPGKILQAYTVDDRRPDEFRVLFLIDPAGRIGIGKIFWSKDPNFDGQDDMAVFGSFMNTMSHFGADYKETLENIAKDLEQQLDEKIAAKMRALEGMGLKGEGQGKGETSSSSPAH
jgi:hypothetical protein